VIRYVAGRLLQSVAILFGVAVVTFALLFLVPADPARQVAGRAATAEIVQRVRHEMGLDQPVAVQFVRYLDRLALPTWNAARSRH
jgi:peptide/nickel transport system permease protein